MTVHLDPRALAALMGSPGARDAAQEIAGQVADEIRDMGIKVGDRDGGKYEHELPLKVRPGRAGARAQIVLAHPSGLAVQAKHGALTKAAARLGLTVRGGS